MERVQVHGRFVWKKMVVRCWFVNLLKGGRWWLCWLQIWFCNGCCVGVALARVSAAGTHGGDGSRLFSTGSLCEWGLLLRLQTVREEASQRRGDGVSDLRRNCGGVGSEMKLFQVMDCEKMEIKNGGCDSDS